MLILIVLQQVHYLKKEQIDAFTYYCPCNYTCGCLVQIRLEFSKKTCAIYSHGQHTMQSHMENNCKYVGNAQKMQLEMVTTEQPQKRRSRISGGKRDLSEELGGSSEDAIGGAQAFSCEDGIGAAMPGGTIRRKTVVGNTEPKSIFHDFAMEKCIYRLLSNNEKGGINLDQVVCLGHQLDDGVFYVGLSTCSMVCNVFRAIASGWDFTYNVRHHRQRE